MRLMRSWGRRVLIVTSGRRGGGLGGGMGGVGERAAAQHARLHYIGVCAWCWKTCKKDGMTPLHSVAKTL